MDDKQFNQLIDKLDSLIKITAANIFQGKPLTESITFLITLGFSNDDIANVLGTTYSYVANVRTDLNKGKKKRKSSKKSKTGNETDKKS